MYRILYMFMVGENTYSYVLQNTATDVIGLLSEVCTVDFSTLTDDMLDPLV